MASIVFENGIVSLDGKELPGILTSLRVSGKVRFDEQQVDGSSGNKKTPQGFEDADINLGLVLLTDDISTCYEKLEEINAVFRGLDSKANPKIYDVTNSHLSARGIRQVVFSDLSSSEDDRSDDMTVRLSFVEHNPPIIKTEAAQAKQPTPTELKEQAEQFAANKQEPEFVISGDLI